MTSKDKITVDDKDFEAFLKREGSLAQLMQKLPQATPSAELDAAILTAAKEELEKAGAAPKPAANAANDAATSENKAVVPSFVRRWRVPLGLAASLLVTVQLVRLQLTEEQTVANAPAILMERAASDAAPAAANLQDKAPVDEGAPALKSGSEEKSKKKVSAPVAAKRLAGDRNEVASEAKTAPAVVSQQPAFERYAPAATQPPVAANTSARATVPAPAPVPAPVAAPALSAAPMPDASRQRVEVTESAIRPAEVEPSPAPAPLAKPDARVIYGIVSPSVSTETINPANVWLGKIDALLKAGSNKEALLEWRKFRKAYPDYAVPDALTEKMKALDK